MSMSLILVFTRDEKMRMETYMRKTWSYGVCETCLKNSHEENKMEKIVLKSEHGSEEVWCCPVCGATKRL